MVRLCIVLAALVALLGLAACGGDDDDGETANGTAAAGAPDVDRYCTLVKELEEKGEEHFATVDEDTSPEEIEAAERGFVEQNAAILDELQRVAPPEIEADLDTFLAGMRQRAGLTPDAVVDKQEAEAAEERVLAFEERECG